MSFLGTLSRKFGFTTAADDAEERSEELDDSELEDEESEEDEEEEESESLFGSLLGRASGKNKKASSRRRMVEDEEEEDEDAERPSSRSSKGKVIHDSRMNARAQEALDVRIVHIVSVRQIEECKPIITHLLQNESLLVNLENIDPKDCGRVVDLLSGAAFALGGRMRKVAHLCYLLAPNSVQVFNTDISSEVERRNYR